MNTTMTDLLLIVLALWFVALSSLMAIAPDRIVRCVKGSKMWRAYLQVVFGLAERDLTAQRLRIRTQGLIGLCFSAFIVVALWLRLSNA